MNETSKYPKVIDPTWIELEPYEDDVCAESSDYCGFYCEGEDYDLGEF
jgi:hypothetical protein